ncbi:MAG: UDP-2,3-diacylglucosamine diphosphatase [Campylobacterota bacterium]|nr:UDP-2,3-diacylglucosamine diphosphatase [Campylobacterota bacterium]
MSLNLFELKQGALIIADAHYSAQRRKLLQCLQDILSGKIRASQLILMGDIFDLLFGSITLTYQRNHEAIKIINAIAQKMQVLYLEGNHDFTVKKYFPNIQVIAFEDQPLHVRFENRDILLAHGDFGADFKYRIYTNIIRSPLTLSLLNFIDKLSFHSIINWLDRYLAKKDDCYKIQEFETLVKQRLQKSDFSNYEALIEGHFHQNRSYNFDNFKYINLGAFACNERYFVVKLVQEALELEEFRLR